MLKDKLKGTLIGVVIGATLTGGIVTAVGTTTLYNVVTQGIKIVVDGKKLNPTDANGKTVEPMIYNGTTYLPVRAVADALGKAVYWDGPEYTVYLGDMDGRLQYPTAYLKDMTNISSDSLHFVNGMKNDNYGSHYSKPLFVWGDGYEYLLNMKYSYFKGTLFIGEGEEKDGTNYMEIIADGKTIYTSPMMTKTSRPVDVNVNVTGCNHIEIQFNGNSYKPTLYLADAGFYQ